MNGIDFCQRMWQEFILRPFFQLIAALLGESSVSLTTWLIVRAARRLPSEMSEECERQWLADFYAFPRWLRLRSALSLFITRGFAFVEQDADLSASRAAVPSASSTSVDSLAGSVLFQPSRSTDALTGLADRRAFEKTLSRLTSPLRPLRQGLSIAVLGIDNFASINKQLGHLAGDAILKEFGRRIRRTLRRSALIARVGGDEFAILLPNTSPAMAAEMAERLCGACRITLVAPNDRVFDMSASVGVSSSLHGLRGAQILNRAESALQRAKGDGRNCVRECLNVE